MSDSQDAFMAALATGQYSKTWLTNKMKQMQEHEKQMAFMGWMAKDPEAKYYMGVALGAATGAVGVMLSKLAGEAETAGMTKEERAAFIKVGKGHGPWWGWLTDPYGSVVREVGDPLGQWTGKGGDTEQIGPTLGAGFATNLSDMIAVGGGSFAAFCGSVLILKAIFSGTDLGELMSGLGEIIPL